jgi:alpha-ketoglutaric semialdehyde dehydrogenase
MGAGQFCTNPGIAVVIDGAEADAFVAAAKEPRWARSARRPC